MLSLALFVQHGKFHIRLSADVQVEAYAALEQYGAASEALQAAGERFPDFIRSPEFKSMRKQLDKLLQ